MLPAGFELAVSTGEQLNTYALDRATTGTGSLSLSVLFNDDISC